MKRLLMLVAALAVWPSGSSATWSLDSLQVGQWYEVPGSHLRTVGYADSSCANCLGTGGLAAITYWSSAAYDNTHHRLVVFGGGHNDRAGNETYAFDVNTLTWSMVEPGTLPRSLLVSSGSLFNTDPYSVNGNAYPASRHTYNGMEYIPTTDQLFLTGGSIWSGAGTFLDNSFVLDLWSTPPAWSNAPPSNWRTGFPGYGSYGNNALWDPVLGSMWVMYPVEQTDRGKVERYYPWNSSWHDHSMYHSWPFYGVTWALDYNRRRAMGIGYVSQYMMDIASDTTWNVRWFNSTGDSSIINNAYPGIQYDPVAKKFSAYYGGPYVWTFDDSTNVWTKLSPSSIRGGTVPAVTGAEYVHGRFRYMPDKNAYVWFHGVDDNVWFYKLSSGGGAPPDTTPGPPPPSGGSGHKYYVSPGMTGGHSGLDTAYVRLGRPISGITGLSVLAAGDTLYFTGGTYGDTDPYQPGFPIYHLNGQAGKPIVITGPASGTRALFVSNYLDNTIRLMDCSYIEISNLDTRERVGHCGVDGVAAKDSSGSYTAHDITLDNLGIYSYDCTTSDALSDQQAVVGISVKCVAWNWTIKNCVIDSVGTGMYFGNSDGTDPCVRFTVDGNFVNHPIGYCMEFKDQTIAARQAGANLGQPTAMGKHIIRNNVFLKTDRTYYAARTNVMLGGTPGFGTGSADYYEVYGNLFHHNQDESELQVCGNVYIYNNIFSDISNTEAGIRVQNHSLAVQGQPTQTFMVRRANIFNNTFYGGAYGIYFADSSMYGTDVAGNALFCGNGIAGAGIRVAQERANVVADTSTASSYVKTPSRVLGTVNLFPIASTPLKGSAIDLSMYASPILYDAYNLDFDGRAKGFQYAGAYASEAPDTAMWCLAAVRKGQWMCTGPPAQPPAKPSTPSLISPSDSASAVSILPTFTWTATGQGAIDYMIEWSTDSQFSTLSYDYPTVGTYAMLAPLSYSRKYYWRVAAHNLAGWSAWSASRQFTTISPPSSRCQ